jgi:hypothetical protein
MKKGFILVAIAVVLLAGYAFSSDLTGMVNVAAEPKPGS